MPSVFTYSNLVSEEDGLAWARTELRIRNQENRASRTEEFAHECTKQRSLRMQAAGLSREEARRYLEMARKERFEGAK